MGVFDFAKDAGAKIGIGDSKEERAAAASAEAAKEVAERIAQRQKLAAERAKAMAESAQAKADAEAEAAAEEEAARAAEGERAEVMEVHLKNLGLGDYEVKIKDGTAVVVGEAASQAQREKAVLAIGNSQGIGTVRDFIRVAMPEPESQMYVVQKGDSLSKIAKEMYGDAMKYPVIFEANEPMLTDPDLIYPGQVLRIPPVT